MTPAKSKLRILIVGGGIGGLVAALALLRKGFDVEVYEQAAELKEVGAGLQLSANGNRALFALGLGEALMARASETAGKEIRLWNTGQTWKLFDLGEESVARYGYPYCTVYRPDLLDALADAVRRAKPDAIRLGARCASVGQDERGVSLALADGREVRGDALIGADGVHSRVRAVLFGDDRPAFTGIIAWRGVMPMAKLPAHLNRRVGTNWVGPGGHVVHYPLRGGELMNFVGVLERDDWRIESWTARGERAECERDYAGWHEDVQAMIRAIDVPYKWALLSRTPLERWSIGRISLLGDACHPTLPFLAQGAVMAIEDGFILARAFEQSGDSVETALARYEAARIDRTRKVVLGSAANAQRFHNQTLADAAQAQRYVDAEWSADRIRERYEWLFRYDVATVAL